MNFYHLYTHGLDNAIQLLLRVGAVVLVAYASMRIPALRRVLNETQAKISNRIIAVIFFGAWAIIGTYAGLIVDMHEGVVGWTTSSGINMQEGQFAIIGFRDAMTLAAGLFGGPWVGLGTGLLAGIHRYSLGGFAATTSACATIYLGLFAGLSRHFFPRWALSIKGILIIALGGTSVQLVIQYVFLMPHSHGINLVTETAVPFAMVNSLGCLLFLMLMKDLDWDILKSEAQRAELRALHAQVEPHFLKNALNSIQTLIGIDTTKASDYICKLREFLDQTRESAKANSITLAEELDQLKRYLEFQGLRFPDKFIYSENVSQNLLTSRVPPRSIQTLIENIFVHARRGKVGLLEIRVESADLGKFLQLSIADNGRGISERRRKMLCKQVVHSKQGSGSALYQIKQSLQLAFNGKADINIKSRFKIGTTITLTLPKRTEPW